MASSKKKFGVVQPRKFISRVKKENGTSFSVEFPLYHCTIILLITLLYHCTIILLITLLYQCTTALLYHYITVPLHHCTIIPMYYYTNVPLYQCTVIPVPIYHYSTYHYTTTEPLYQYTIASVCRCIHSNDFFHTVIFNNMQQQDSHELLNYLLNTIADLLAGKTD